MCIMGGAVASTLARVDADEYRIVLYSQYMRVSVLKHAPLPSSPISRHGTPLPHAIFSFTRTRARATIAYLQVEQSTQIQLLEVHGISISMATFNPYSVITVFQ